VLTSVAPCGDARRIFRARGSNVADGRPVDLWPHDGLEDASSCPVCGESDREPAHVSLTDRIFFCAPGEWNMYRCASCRTGYLDPRPTRETIGLAYESYYTHEVARKKSDDELGWLQRARRGAANSYRNLRYGTDDRPANALGGALLTLLPGQRTMIDTESRHLPKPRPGARLLDIGCGDGRFLEFARRAGWSVVGVDFDQKAVDAARSLGLDIRLGGVEAIGAEERFDGVTLSHVIEHVHDPIGLLRACYRLLRPGGWIWLQTPNVDSQGHRLYGANWRGLEPPRHLVLFTPASLGSSLTAAGFTDVALQRAVLGCEFTFSASEVIARGDSFDNQGEHAVRIRPRIQAAEKAAARDPSIREFITVKAWKR
jgi:2-polyprenyl-3-methyl-5-hydroxy-6-metoxy-1,4-benzoquinol methylase